ncbi:hypothetical protein D3C80_2045450 [compost metagenome]
MTLTSAVLPVEGEARPKSRIEPLFKVSAPVLSVAPLLAIRCPPLPMVTGPETLPPPPRAAPVLT